MTAERQRLFFALWPDDHTRSALARIARERLAGARGRLVAAENLHLTLAFLGSRDADYRACAERAAERLSARAFTLEFVRTGYWPRPRVLWAAPDRTPEALEGLASTLSNALVQCGHEPESRPFRAHITLARKVRGPLDEAVHTPVRWRVGEFCLVASETRPEGARYSRLRSWSLQ
jgi:2'-5' RNA ligase